MSARVDYIMYLWQSGPNSPVGVFYQTLLRNCRANIYGVLMTHNGIRRLPGKKGFLMNSQFTRNRKGSQFLLSRKHQRSRQQCCFMVQDFLGSGPGRFSIPGKDVFTWGSMMTVYCIFTVARSLFIFLILDKYVSFFCQNRIRLMHNFSVNPDFSRFKFNQIYQHFRHRSCHVHLST